MKTNQKVIIGLMVIVVLAIGLFGYNSLTNDAGSEELDKFAQCLTEKGVQMYGTEWCSHCKNQKKLFGSSFEFIDYIDCDEDRAECVKAEVTGYPTWRVNGQNYPGEKSLERLGNLGGCEL